MKYKPQTIHIARKYATLPFTIEGRKSYLAMMSICALLGISLALYLSIEMSNIESPSLPTTIAIYAASIALLFLAFSFLAYVLSLAFTYHRLLYVSAEGIKHFEHKQTIYWRHIVSIKEDFDGITISTESLGNASPYRNTPLNPLRLFGLSFLSKLFTVKDPRTTHSAQLKRQMIAANSEELTAALKHHLKQQREGLTKRTL